MTIIQTTSTYEMPIFDCKVEKKHKRRRKIKSQKKQEEDKSLTKLWEKERTKARFDLVCKWTASILFLPVPKMISLGAIASPFDYTNYASALVVIEIAKCILRSTLKKIVYDKTHHVEGEGEGFKIIPRKYSLSNLAKYKILKDIHVTNIKEMLKDYESAEKNVSRCQCLYNQLNDEVEDQIREFRLSCLESAKEDIARVEKAWIHYRDTVIAHAFPKIKINL